MNDEPQADEELLLDALGASEVLVLATRGEDGTLHATPLFHAPTADFVAPCLVFASKPSSLHGEHLGEGPTRVAAGTHVPHDSFLKLRGTQLRGDVWPIESCADAARRTLRGTYLKRYPMAVALLAKALLAPPEEREQLYVLALSWGKLTDNARLGLGMHREWSFPDVREALGVGGG